MVELIKFMLYYGSRSERFPYYVKRLFREYGLLVTAEYNTETQIEKIDISVNKDMIRFRYHHGKNIRTMTPMTANPSLLFTNEPGIHFHEPTFDFSIVMDILLKIVEEKLTQEPWYIKIQRWFWRG